MGNLKLWKQLDMWKNDCKWVDLTHALSSDTPHWVGWPDLEVETKVDLNDSIFLAHMYKTVGQYGTHVDAPNHMVNDGRSLDQIKIEEMVLPLCVIDKSVEAENTADYILTEQDIKSWENEYGKIPEYAFVAFRTDWSKKEACKMDNLDADGNRHFPGWDLNAIRFLTEKRNVGGIGHETSDTEAPITSGLTNYEVEHFILAQDRIQIEMLTNLDQCPPVGGIIFCTFPKVMGGSGFPARCFALCPK